MISSSRQVPMMWTSLPFSAAGKARAELGWEAEYGIEEMCADSWRWQSMNPDGYATENDA